MNAWRQILCSGIVALMASCASDAPQPRSIVLQAMGQPTPGAAVLPPEVVVVVDRVILPDYLKRNALIERLANNELIYHETVRWAEPLTEAVPRDLADELSSLFARSVTTARLRSDGGVPQNTRLLWVDVRRLDADRQGVTTLDAHYTWMREGQAVTPWRRGQYIAQSVSTDPQHVAAAHSQVLQALAKDAAQSLLGAKP